MKFIITLMMLMFILGSCEKNQIHSTKDQLIVLQK